MHDLQLEMNFAAYRNRFRDALDHGEFVMLVEHNSPSKECDPKTAKTTLENLELAALSIRNLNCALAITDAYGVTGTGCGLEYALNLTEENRDRHVIYLSGRDRTLAQTRDLLQMAGGGGLHNLVPVTGDAVPGENVRSTRARNFTESVHTLHMLNERHTFAVFPGTVMNPFQYTPYTLYPQYFKLVKKLDCGAKFIVAQAGWDILKFQALRWYLGEHGLFFPTIARLILLTPEKVEEILDRRMPGVKISPDFRDILDKELRFSLNQFEAAQWRRLELLAAGCRLLGYSGVQISGIDTPQKIKLAADRIGGALQEFTTFEQWLEEYNSYLARAEMAPIPNSFYLYDRFLRRPYPETPPRMAEIGKNEVSLREKCQFQLRRFLFSNSDIQDAANRRFLKMLLCGCRSCNKCRLPQTFYICPNHCPKRSSNGPCGGVRADGSCEVGNFECIHSYMMRLAQYSNEISKLEEKYLPPPQDLLPDQPL